MACIRSCTWQLESRKSAKMDGKQKSWFLEILSGIILPTIVGTDVPCGRYIAKITCFLHPCCCCLWFFLTQLMWWIENLAFLIPFLTHLCFSQGLWFDKDSSLWMLPCMNEDLQQSLRKRGISTVQQLLDLPGATLQAMIGNFPASRFYQVSNHLDVCATFLCMENTQLVHRPFWGWDPLPITFLYMPYYWQTLQGAVCAWRA